MDIKLRDIEIKDLNDYLYWNHPQREFHKFNGPYFKKETEKELQLRVINLQSRLEKEEINVLGNKKIIANAKNNEIIGEVNWYWKSKETDWLEVGIVIFNENYWGSGIGYKALRTWIDMVFNIFPQIKRIGFTTWSGNQRMINLGEKLKLKKEAVYRNARVVENKYYDSVSYGILKDEWYNINYEQNEIEH
jgi:putative hydrolase of HD superfamily